MMKQKVLYVFVAALFSTAGMAQNKSTSKTIGHDNFSTIKQAGNGLTATVIQGLTSTGTTSSSDYNEATIIQGNGTTKSYDSTAKILQTGGGLISGFNDGDNNTNKHTANITQLGESNYSDIQQGGTGHLATISQEGDVNAPQPNSGDNWVTIDQSGSYHEASITQAGDFNDADIKQVGSDHEATIAQTGDSNDADIDQQSGSANKGTITQYGNSNIASITQTLGGNTTTVNQGATGNGNSVTNTTATITQGKGNVSTVDQTASYNTATIAQDSYNKAIVNQSGLGLSDAPNTVDITQNNDGNWASATQSPTPAGSANNKITITQTSGETGLSALPDSGNFLNVATVEQTGFNNNTTFTQNLVVAP